MFGQRRKLLIGQMRMCFIYRAFYRFLSLYLKA
nr:MAG TPA: hypothetical protein [Caudoviricetes sp.]